MSKAITGHLYTRGKNNYYYIRYKINGKLFQYSLRDENNNPVTSKKIAEKLKADILAPYNTTDRKRQRLQAVAALQEAEEKAAEIDEKLNPPLSVTEAWEAYIAAPSRPDSGERTLKDYTGYFSRFIEWLEKNYPDKTFLRDVDEEIAERYAGHLSRGRSANTYNKHIRLLKLVFKTLEKKARIVENPFSAIRSKKNRDKSRRELTMDELRNVLEQTNGEFKILFTLGTFTGLRLGDCATLKWSEINLRERTIKRIPNKTASRRAKPVFVGIPEILYSQLNCTPKSQRRGYVLPDIAERYLDTNHRTQLSRIIQRYFTSAGIDIHAPGTGPGTGKRAIVEVGFHSLRHTYVTLHAKAGTPEAVIKQNVGHASPAMVAHYTHVSAETAKQIAEVIDIQATTVPSRQPLPEWAAELLETMTANNWEEVKKELLSIE